MIRAKKALYKPNEAIEIYFPIRGIISLVNISKAGPIAEFATVSNEATIDLETFLGDDFVANLAIAQTDCLAISLPVNVLRQEFACGGELQPIVLLYSQIFLAQLTKCFL